MRQRVAVGAGLPGTGAESDQVKARTRVPWIVWAIAMLLVVGSLTLSALNRDLDEDPLLTVLYLAIILGYSTVGAVLASRRPTNPIGWLMMVAGLALVVAGFGEVYLVYGLRTRPGSLPGVAFAAMLSNLAWGPLLVVLILVVLLFPNGRVPGPRWRFLPSIILALFALGLAGMLLAPGLIDAVVKVRNPIGVPALESVAGPAETIGFAGLLPALAASIVALVLRFRRSEGEERQQIRWLVYVVIVAALLIFIAIADEILWSLGTFGDVLFVTTVTLIGIGAPIAIGIAILKYRLYDLDLVVKKTVLYTTVAVLLSSLFVSVAFAIGRAGGRTQAGAVVAAAVIGLAFWPAVRLASRVADRVVYGRRATPYEVLADFSTRVAGSYGTEDVLPQMAATLAAAVGARRAVVWLRLGDELRPVAVAPDSERLPGPVRMVDEVLSDLSDDSTVEVRDRGELLGALAVSMPANDPINASKERLVHDLASQAGLVLRNVRLVEELRASRQRLVAAQDEERRRLERNIHDGAQQQLVALTVKLRILEQLAPRNPAKAAEMASRLQSEAREALEELRDLARGIYPPLLADKGLAAALEAQARKSTLPVRVIPDGVGRYPQEIESALYFCCLEALQNVAKYAHATHVEVRLSQTAEEIAFQVIDDGDGFDLSAMRRGSGLQGMADRLDAIGGTMEVRSQPGRGTTVSGRVSVEASGRRVP